MQSCFIRLIAVEVSAHDFVIELNSSVDQQGAIFNSLVFQVGWNFFIVVIRAESFVFPNNSLHAYQINDALEVVLGADWQLNTNSATADLGFNVSNAFVEIGADLVHLVDEHNARNVVLVGLTPNSFGLWLNALVAVKNAHSAVEHAQRALNFNGEVNVAGGVDDVQALAIPESRGRSRSNRDATLLLLLHPIHGRSAVMHFANFVRLA